MSNQPLKTGVDALFGLSESELELELGRRLSQTRLEVQTQAALSATEAGGPTVDSEALQGLPDFARDVSRRFLSLFNQQMYALICDNTDPDNKTIRDAATKGAEALGYALSGAFVAAFGWLPGIATVVAVIVAKRVAKAGYQGLCESWKAQL